MLSSQCRSSLSSCRSLLYRFLSCRSLLYRPVVPVPVVPVPVVPVPVVPVPVVPVPVVPAGGSLLGMRYDKGAAKGMSPD